MNRASWWQDETDEKIDEMRRDYAKERRRASLLQWSIIIGTVLAAIAVVVGLSLG